LERNGWVSIKQHRHVARTVSGAPGKLAPPLRFLIEALLVNANAESGMLRMEILKTPGRPFKDSPSPTASQ